ncbi:hypothetical protein E1176_14625 [Fulvivirga sp. RKSG066]|uniref:hypothetical protein n=1 Tax=Fulvivirga aurantia TaxID=2529383 RepID=UPI0012BCEBC0|nr:hypothetical protein [Fulvivirga aurantia]MTI22263.1 hypothetical protein [Fulvivirga aurantia]
MLNIKKLIFLSLGLFCLGFTSQAQTTQTDILDFENLVLQLSQTSPGGSARIRGLGQAQTALGGDISNASSNPAGLGFFNRSEFSFTPNFNYSNSQTDYLNRTTNDGKLNFNFANMGVVLNSTKSDVVDSKWRGGNFAISLNRVADFSNSITYEGFNEVSDFIDFAVDAENFTGRTDLSDLAFNTFLTDEFFVIYNGDDGTTNELDSISINGLQYYIPDLYGSNLQNGDSLFFVDRNIYTSDGSLAFPTQDNPTFQQESINSRGSSYQASFAYGGNYNDKLYFGASIGIMAYNHEVERIYTERPSGADLSRFTLEDYFEQSGVGINATIGVIGRPATSLLLGFSYTTPTFYAVEQLRTLSATAEYPGFDTEFDEIIYEPFDYSVRTPAKLNLGATYFFGKNGFITGDIERVNYASAKLGNASDGQGFSGENQSVDRFESVFNYRTGIEFRFGKIRARGGAAYLQDPIDDDLDQDQLTLSVGGGLRTKKYYTDVSIMNTVISPDNTISPYPGAAVATSQTDRTRVSISVGWFF